MRVHFKALESALIDEPKTPNRQDVGKDVGLDEGYLYEHRIKNTDNRK